METQREYLKVRGTVSEIHEPVVSEVKKINENAKKIDMFFKVFKDGKYLLLLQQIVLWESKVLRIEMDDLLEYLGPSIYRSIVKNCLRYMEIFHSITDAIIKDPDFREKTRQSSPEIHQNSTGIDDLLEKEKRNTWSVQRERGMRRAGVPAFLRNEFEIHLIPSKSEPVVGLRGAMVAANVGAYVTVEADVVREGPALNQVKVAAYRCSICGEIAYQSLSESIFTPLKECPSSQCKGGGSLKFFPRLCRIILQQDVRLQESAHQVPQGDVPYALNCIATNSLTASFIPGSTMRVSGVVHIGLRNRWSGNTRDRSQLTFHILYYKNNKLKTQETPEEEMRIENEINELRRAPRLYETLAFNIAPEIYGMEDVKKALLLELIGGISTVKHDGGLIRGDIHILLMGDPGVAKSQLMKRVCEIAGKSVYSTGMGSSGVGLTAAIIKDNITGETTLEGGALVMADGGLCAIDEFDKMDEYDRSAIYEVMEQQSVSIAKAGHCNTLPARCAVLAAANPVEGRYNIRKSILANINLPAALLTRFDLQFLLLDIPDLDRDRQTAEHILNVTRDIRTKYEQFKRVDTSVFRKLIENCRSINPSLPSDLIEEIGKYYAELRATERDQETSGGDRSSYTTLRAVFAWIRMSQALARLRGSLEVSIADFHEARRLTVASKQSVTPDVPKKRRDPIIEIYNLIRDLWLRRKHYYQKREGLSIEDIERQVITQGFQKCAVDDTIEKYESLGVIYLNEARTHMKFVEISCSDESE